jgi:glycosyltransferase involved in cell wall biosynthesis
VRDGRLRVLFVGRFARDEPVENVIAAAAMVPEIDIVVTGDLDRCPPHLLENAPGNVEFVGFLDPLDYEAAVVGADVIMCLTTESGSVMRSAYEAVYACRPLIVSGWPVAGEFFPSAVQTENLTSALVEALKEADTRFDELVALAGPARELQLDRFEEQRRSLLRRLGGRTKSAGGLD